MIDKTFSKILSTMSLLVFTEKLKEEKALNAEDYAVAIASVTKLAIINGIGHDDLQRELDRMVGNARN
jgi:hypothetical protein